MNARLLVVKKLKARYGTQNSDFYNFDEINLVMVSICADIVVTYANRK